MPEILICLTNSILNTVSNSNNLLFVQDYAIILEEHVIPTADFLAFMAQCFPVVKKDKSLIGISAWNENGMY